jgi:hypothetical protein
MCQGRVLSKPVQPVPKARITSEAPSFGEEGNGTMPGSSGAGYGLFRTGQAACLFAPFETLVQFNKRLKTHMSQANPLPRRFSALFWGTSARAEID